MPYPVECRLEVNEDVIEVLLVLEVLLAQYPQVEDLLCCAASWSEASLFLGNDLFRLGFQSVHNFFLMTLLGCLMRLMVR